MAAKYVISADSHMMEPANLWVERLDAKYKDDAPRVVKSDNKGDFLFVAPGIPSCPVAGGFAAGRSGQELKDFLSEAGQDKGYEAARPSGWDPAERLKDQDIDGVHAEVLYTTLGMPLFGLHDTDLQRACFRAYNDWVAEFASHSPKRLHAIALVSLDDLGFATAREAVLSQGLRSVLGGGRGTRDAAVTSRDHRQTAAQVEGGTREDPLAQPRFHPRLYEPDSRGAAVAHGHYLRRRHDALPEDQNCLGRERHRLDRPLHVSDGPCVREVQRDDVGAARGEAE